MNPTSETLLQSTVMTGIVATLLCVPLWALTALACNLLFDLPPHAFVTFGDRLNEPAGALAWWALAWLPASIYSAFMMPRG